MDIYVQKDGQRQGPFSEAKIRQRIDAGEFSSDDLAWTEGKASWQPLSVLINLDVTKPPPMPVATSIPVGLPFEKDFLAVEPAPTPANVPPLNFAPQKSEGPLCKACGAPYNRWSLLHAMGSGLCRRCAKASVKPKQPAIWEKEVQTPEDAHKAIRATVIYFVLCAILNFCLGFVWMPIVTLCSVLAIWRFHSRIAIILLIALTTIDFLTLFIYLMNGAALFGMAIGAMIDSIGFLLCIRSWQAVGKLRTGFIRGS